MILICTGEVVSTKTATSCAPSLPRLTPAHHSLLLRNIEKLALRFTRGTIQYRPQYWLMHERRGAAVRRDEMELENLQTSVMKPPCHFVIIQQYTTARPIY